MRVPNVRGHFQTLRLILALFLGMILGACLMVLQSGKTIDALYKENLSLQNEILSLQEKLDTLKNEQLNLKNSQARIHEIIVHIEGAPNGLIEAELYRRILQDTQFLIGKSVQSLSETFETLFRIFERKVYRVTNHKIEVELEHLVISNEVHLFIKIMDVQPA